MSDYPDADWPYTFYFNGHELPKWSAQWHLCDRRTFLNGFEDDWDEFIGCKHIRHLQCRLDHVGVVESEDPGIFRVCVQEVLLRLIRHREEVLKSMRVSTSSGDSPEKIFHGLVEGAARMLELCAQERRAFWTSGYAADQAQLKEFMSGCPNEETRADSVVPPHVSQRRSELESRAGFQLKALRALAQSGTLEKRLRQIVNQLPDR
jgi:hypothetical protein